MYWRGEIKAQWTKYAVGFEYLRRTGMGNQVGTRAPVQDFGLRNFRTTLLPFLISLKGRSLGLQSRKGKLRGVMCVDVQCAGLLRSTLNKSHLFTMVRKSVECDSGLSEVDEQILTDGVKESVSSVKCGSPQLNGDAVCLDEVIGSRLDPAVDPAAKNVNSSSAESSNAKEGDVSGDHATVSLEKVIHCSIEDGRFPIPLSPFPEEHSKCIEYDRAMVAELAMKSGPAVTLESILYEDEWLLVIDKPCGLYSEHVLATVPALLCPDSERVGHSTVHLHMANRLDRDTSGVMVITKCKEAAGKMSKIFTSRDVLKTYIALSTASLPTWEKLTIQSGHGRSRFGAWRVYAQRDIGRELPGKSVVREMTTRLEVVSFNRELVNLGNPHAASVVLTGSQEKAARNGVLIVGDDSVSESRRPMLGNSPQLSSQGLVGRMAETEGNEVIIRAFPLTGRTHQVRLHCMYVGLPLRGDVKYGGPHFWKGVRYDQHALHAESLAFKHPFTLKDVLFVSPYPQWAKDSGVQPYVPDMFCVH